MVQLLLSSKSFTVSGVLGWLGSVVVGRKIMFERHRFCDITMAHPSAYFRMDSFMVAASEESVL